MKKLLLAAGIIVGLLASIAAHAENTGYDKGFFIKNEEGTFKLTFNGRVQNKLYFQKQGTTDSVATFKLRRALLKTTAVIGEKVTAAFELKHAVAPGGTFDTVNLANAYVAIDIIPDKLSFSIGQVGLPLDMITDTSSSAFILTEAPVTSTQDDGIETITPLRPSFGTPDGLGINLSGGVSKWFYTASVVNGAESNYLTNGSGGNPNKRFSFGLRTGINILDAVPGSQTDYECSSTPKLTVSAGTMYQGKRDVDYDGNGVNDTTINYLWTSSLGVGFRWGGLAFTGEGYYRKTRIPVYPATLWWGRTNLTDIGYYAALGYYVIPKTLEIATQVGQSIRQGPQNDSWQFGGGLNYYIIQKNLKLQLDYTLTKYFNDTTLSGGQIGIQGVKKHVATFMLTALF